MNLDKEVLRVFRRLRIAPDHGLSQGMLVKEWARLSLRRRDLDVALRRLMALCYLRQEKTPDGDMLYVTPVGQEYADELFQNPLVELWQRVSAQWQALWRSRPAATDTDYPARRRRLADRIAPTVG